jgi:hypothetical protein
MRIKIGERLFWFRPAAWWYMGRKVGSNGPAGQHRCVGGDPMNRLPPGCSSEMVAEVSKERQDLRGGYRHFTVPV